MRGLLHTRSRRRRTRFLSGTSLHLWGCGGCGGGSEGAKRSLGACLPGGGQSMPGTQPPSTQIISRDSWLPPRVLWNPPPRARGSPKPHTCWLRDPGVLGCWSHDLAPGLCLPAPKADLRGLGLEGRGPGQPPPKDALLGLAWLGASAGSDAGCGWARAPPGCAPRGGGGGGAGAGGAGRGGSPWPVSAAGLPTQRPGGRCSFLLAPDFKRPSHLHSCFHPFIHTFRIHSTFLPPATLLSERTYCVPAGPGQLRRATVQRWIPAPPLPAASPS